MTPAEQFYEVGLRFSTEHYVRVGVLHARQNLTWFELDSAYMQLPNRPILGLIFEDDPNRKHRSNNRLPAWFSNLLPEGPLRDILAKQAGIKPTREMKLLSSMGENLPGAVVVKQTESGLGEAPDGPTSDTALSPTPRKFRFSLAGVQHKLSLSNREDRFTLPMDGEQDGWIVKFPSREFPELARMEYATMSLAKELGIEVPEIRLVTRSEIEVEAEFLWPNEETEAFAIRRFDRNGDRRVHQEDFAQVRNTMASNKYEGSMETMANIAYRGHDEDSLMQFVRRLAFNVLVRNGDAHLKNWSLLYRDPRKPVLSPAYDLISTQVYAGRDNVLEPKFAGESDFGRIRLHHFQMLQKKLRAGADLRDVATSVCDQIQDAWLSVRTALREPHRSAMDSLLSDTVKSLTR